MGATIIRIGIALGLALASAADAAPRTYDVVVSSNGWHTDITVARADIPAGKIPESSDFAEAQYLQFGWGDKDYYTTPDPGLGTTLGAAFPGPAVVHVAGLAAPPDETFSGVEQVSLTLDETQFARLINHLHASFERADKPRVEAMAPGVYDFSRFYPGTGEFHLFNTCNTWTARALAAAGLDVKAAGVQEADDVMRQLRKKQEE